MDDVRNAWTAAMSRDASILRCDSCGQFLEGMTSKIDKVLVENDDSDVETFFCAICTDHKSMCSCSRCQGCPHHFYFNCIIDNITYGVLRGEIHDRCPEPGCTIGMCCPEPMCTIGELTYEFWYKHVVDDVQDASI
uniref:Uncharacterized protein n=1 Tax=Leersia perrieri TaxID=77586 RepID=A0A0D9XRD9_9ORYZ